jgi:hypothetical protein
MNGMLWVVGAGTVLFAGLVSYVVALRYGWGLAVMLPLLALITMIGMRWQKEGMSASEGLATLGPMLMFSAPVLLGAVVGIAVARIKRG